MQRRFGSTVTALPECLRLQQRKHAMTSHISLHAAPAAGFDEPFEMLLACHERVLRMLQLLQRLGGHLADRGNDSDARQAARDVMRYFDIAGPAHHQDEERHLFPALLAAAGPHQAVPEQSVQLVQLVQRLHQDHSAMEQGWRQVRADLQAVCEGAPVDGGLLEALAAARARWQQFAELYAAHIVAEEGEAYPAARALLDEPALQQMGDEMAARRGVPGRR